MPVHMRLPLDSPDPAYLSVLYDYVRDMGPEDLVFLTWDGKTVARIIVGA